MQVWRQLDDTQRLSCLRCEQGWAAEPGGQRARCTGGSSEGPEPGSHGLYDHVGEQLGEWRVFDVKKCCEIQVVDGLQSALLFNDGGVYGLAICLCGHHLTLCLHADMMVGAW